MTMKELIEIQRKLKAPKSQYNKFGNFSYRSCEDILEAVKPLLAEQECTLILSDNITLVGDKHYITATATIKNTKGETEQAVAIAREPDEKKGMDASQITGSASSYARKYALNGLFAIDDNKDADALPSKEEIDSAIDKANKAKNTEELTQIWNDMKHLQNNESFKKAVTKKGKELKGK